MISLALQPCRRSKQDPARALAIHGLPGYSKIHFVMHLLRKLTTRPVWSWEKRRPYPIRGQWRRLPALTASGEHPFIILTTPATFSDALWAAWSWLRFLAPLVHLEVVLDGEITPFHREALAALSPGAALTSTREIVAAAREWPPALREFVENHPLGRKLGLVLARQEKAPFLYSDSDVLAFQEPRELIQALRLPKASYFISEPDEGSFDPALVETARMRGLAPRARLNSGLLLVPRQSLELNLANELLAARSGAFSWFTEQTLLALLLSREAEALPRERYVVSTARQFYWEKDVDYNAIAARHFTGPTRHVMYLKGLRWLALATRLNNQVI